MEDKRRKCVTLACNVLVLNHLKSLNLHDLAEELQQKRRIPSSVANAFPNLTLKRVLEFDQRHSHPTSKTDSSKIDEIHRNEEPPTKKSKFASFKYETNHKSTSQSSCVSPSKVTTQSINRAKDFANSNTTAKIDDSKHKVCMRVVMKHLQKNGFQEIANELRSAKNGLSTSEKQICSKEKSDKSKEQVSTKEKSNKSKEQIYTKEKSYKSNEQISTNEKPDKSKEQISTKDKSDKLKEQVSVSTKEKSDKSKEQICTKEKSDKSSKIVTANRSSEKQTVNESKNQSVPNNCTSTKTLNAKEKLTKTMCDQIVLDYLEKNSFQEVAEEIKKTKIFHQSDGATKVSLEKLLDLTQKPTKREKITPKNYTKRNNLSPSSPLGKSLGEENRKQTPISKTSKFEEKIENEKSQNLQETNQPQEVNKPKKVPKQTNTSSKDTSKSTHTGNTEHAKDGKPYDAWSNIREGYGDLLDKLNPDDPDSELDKVVAYILNLNITVQHVNILFNKKSCNYPSSRSAYKRSCPGLRRGRFTKGINGEDGIIKKNWDELIKAAAVKSPDKCLEDAMKFDFTSDHESTKKKTVIGCYLAQSLPYIRHGIDVFWRAIALILPWKSGKFTKEDDQIILEEVAINGEIQQTWLKLSKILNRFTYETISSRYLKLKEKQSNKIFGKWTKADNEMLVEQLFAHKGKLQQDHPVDAINAIDALDLRKAATFLNRSFVYVFDHWMKVIKPTLLSYHNKTLHGDWKRDFLYYLYKRKICSTQEIEWQDAKLHFPCHNPSSLSHAYGNVTKYLKKSCQPLYLIVKDYLQRTKHHKEKESTKKMREDLVRSYDKARGVLNDSD